MEACTNARHASLVAAINRQLEQLSARVEGAVAEQLQVSSVLVGNLHCRDAGTRMALLGILLTWSHLAIAGGTLQWVHVHRPLCSNSRLIIGMAMVCRCVWSQWRCGWTCPAQSSSMST